MIWNFVIIGAVVVIFLVLARRIPTVYRLQKEKAPDVTPEEIAQMSVLAQADDAFEKENYDRAEELYVQSATQDPANKIIYERLGIIYLERNNFYDAKDAFLQSIKLGGEEAESYANLGLSYFGLKDFYKACQSFQRAIKLEPRNKQYNKLFEKAQKAHEREKNRHKK